MSDIKNAVTPDEYDEAWTADDALKNELECLWGDLATARHNALNGRWSIQCGSVAWRIANITKVLGKPTPPESVQVSLLLNGWYTELHEAIGIEAPISAETMAQAQQMRAEGRA